MTLKLQCRHCFWFRRRQMNAKQTCEDMGVILTSMACSKFAPNYFDLPPKVRELVHLMGQIKNADLPLVVYLAETQRKINKGKRTKNIQYKIGDSIQYKMGSEVFDLTINHITEEHVLAETQDGEKHFTILHSSVIFSSKEKEKKGKKSLVETKKVKKVKKVSKSSGKKVKKIRKTKRARS